MKEVELAPREWSSSESRPAPPAPRPRYTLKIFLLAVALSAIYNVRSIIHAASSVTAAAPVATPPGNYSWTPEHGLQPVTAGSPATQPRR